MNTQSNRATNSVLNTSRMAAFSDGVFAVAITLLILNIQVPQIPASLISGNLPHTLFALWPKLLIYALSFVIVGIYWVAHHNTFHYIERVDRTLLWINILLLMCIVFVPFPTALLGQYPGQQISIVFYSSTLVITGLTLQLLWWYATSNYRLVDREIDPRFVQRVTRRNLLAPLIYLLAIGTSFLNTQASFVFFILVPVLYIFPGRIDQHWTNRRTRSTNKATVSTDGDAGPSGEEVAPLQKDVVS